MLLRAPASWPTPVAVAMLLLPAVDLVGAYVAKEAVVGRSLWSVAGVALSGLLLDHQRSRSALSPDTWMALAVILAAQAYRLLASSDAVPPSVT